MGLVSLILFAFVAAAEQVAPGKGDRLTVGEGPKSLPVYKVLSCIQASAPDSLFFNPDKNKADCAIRMFAPSMQVSVNKRGMSKNEFAMFLSQTIGESYFFTELKETPRPGTGLSLVPACSGTPGVKKDLSITDVINSTVGGASAASTTQYAGANLGAGIVHLTGMDNNISALDYLIQRARLGRGEAQAEWKKYWEFPYLDTDGDGKKEMYQIKPGEKDVKVLKAFREWYSTQYRPGQDLNIYGLWENPDSLLTPGEIATDAQLYGAGSERAEVNTATLTVEIAMAYWRERCDGEMAKYAANYMYKGKYDPDTYFTPEGRAMRAAMKCVKGREGPEKDRENRYDWFNLAKACADKYM